MQIGNVTLKNNVFLAPMAGVTDLAFRRMCVRYGAGLVYSEMVSSKALYYNDKKTKQLLNSTDDEKPLAVQIFGSDPDIMAKTAYMALETGAQILDINMGCPAPKIVNNGDGSALMKNPELIGKIVSAVVKTVEVPVTCKIRSGFDAVNAVEVAKIIEANGASAVAVHPRTRSMYYSGKADWGIIKAVKESVSIPVIGNGDVFCAQDAAHLIEHTRCDAIMVGRGAQGNPFIFKQILEYMKHGKVTYYPDTAEKVRVIGQHIFEMAEDKGEHIAVLEARKHVAWYIKGMRESAAMRQKVNTMTNLPDLLAAIEEYAEFCEENN
ncbi:MAG: tRNA dihydrouridine synthase DusB [Clostridia bacterium]|nr:tRNA dihydrouridine synthase DusB [Clostridia bacterium]